MSEIILACVLSSLATIAVIYGLAKWFMWALARAEAEEDRAEDYLQQHRDFTERHRT